MNIWLNNRNLNTSVSNLAVKLRTAIYVHFIYLRSPSSDSIDISINAPVKCDYFSQILITDQTEIEKISRKAGEGVSTGRPAP